MYNFVSIRTHSTLAGCQILSNIYSSLKCECSCTTHKILSPRHGVTIYYRGTDSGVFTVQCLHIVQEAKLWAMLGTPELISLVTLLRNFGNKPISSLGLLHSHQFTLKNWDLNFVKWNLRYQFKFWSKPLFSKISKNAWLQILVTRPNYIAFIPGPQLAFN